MTRFVFLCAGRGQRMRLLTQDRCKAMVSTASGKAIMEQSLDNLVRVLPQEDYRITIIGGYQFDRLQAWLHDWSNTSGRPVTLRRNALWAECGPLGSLLQLQNTDFSDQGMCILNGDTVYDPVIFEIVQQMIRAGKDGLVCSETEELDPDAILVRRSGPTITAAGKTASPPQVARYLVSAGCMVLSTPVAMVSLRQQLTNLQDPAAAEALKRNPWHSLVSLIAAQTPMMAEIVSDTSWREYDTPECLSVITDEMKGVAL